jgi:hypothetical protein
MYKFLISFFLLKEIEAIALEENINPLEQTIPIMTATLIGGATTYFLFNSSTIKKYEKKIANKFPSYKQWKKTLSQKKVPFIGGSQLNALKAVGTAATFFIISLISYFATHRLLKATVFNTSSQSTEVKPLTETTEFNASKDNKDTPPTEPIQTPETPVTGPSSSNPTLLADSAPSDSTAALIVPEVTSPVSSGDLPIESAPTAGPSDSTAHLTSETSVTGPSSSNPTLLADSAPSDSTAALIVPEVTSPVSSGDLPIESAPTAGPSDSVSTSISEGATVETPVKKSWWSSAYKIFQEIPSVKSSVLEDMSSEIQISTVFGDILGNGTFSY